MTRVRQRRHGSAAARLAPLVARLVGTDGLPFTVQLWDGSTIPAAQSSRSSDPITLVIRDRAALERVVHAPNELGIARAWVAGEVEVHGGIERAAGAVLGLGPVKLTLADRLAIVATAARLGAIRPSAPAIPEIEARLTGRRRSLRRDRAAISFHYDLPDAFYELVLGPTRGYTCGYFARPEQSLDSSQMEKFDRVCTKLDLRPGERLLDIGCGWGSLMIHAAREYDAQVVGLTISASQAEEVRRRIRAAGVSDRCEVRLCDWREINDGPYDKVASIEMIEHVGGANLPDFFAANRALVAPDGLVFTQAMSRPSARRLGSDRFIPRYIFPDGEIVPFDVLLESIRAGQLEIRDVESLSDHYPPTLRLWTANLEANRERAIEMVGSERVRAWELYLASAAVAFVTGTLSVHQIVAAPLGTAASSSSDATAAAEPTRAGSQRRARTRSA